MIKASSYTQFKRSLFLLFFSLISLFSISQTYTFSGKIRDGISGESLFGVNVILQHFRDTNIRYGSSTGSQGDFEITGIQKGMYRVELSYVGYFKKVKEIRIFENLRMDTLVLFEDAQLLREAVVRENVIPVQQNGDTTEYNADAFKTNTDADAADLVKKMPGITTKDGKIMAQGEEVKKVTVDGQEFFGEDAMLALKNLPAEIIAKVQVYDKLSDQSQFTGYNDGNTTKTINIITKTGKTDGQFGKVFAGYGTDNHYNTGFNANFFNGKQRITLLGMSNDINQQNFSNDDLLGALSVDKDNNRRGRRYGPQTGTDPSDFLVGEQGGVNQAHSLGLNYTDLWGSKLKVNGSYFVNGLQNTTQQSLQRAYYLNRENDQNYAESNQSNSSNISHRMNLRMQYTLDSNNSIIFTPRLSFQGNLASSSLKGENSLDNNFLSSTLNETFNNRSGFNYSHDLLFQHKFNKEGRTISLGTNLGLASSNKENTLSAENRYANSGSDSLMSLDQLSESTGQSNSMGIRLMYTEPLGKKGQLTINYSPSRSQSLDQTDTRQFDTASGTYQNYDSLLSNNLNNRIDVQQAGAGIRYRSAKIMFFGMVNYQYSELYAEQKVPGSFVVDKPFNAILPFGYMRYEFSKGNQMRLFYRTSTSLPNASQLQDRLDNSNPLLLSRGNPDLNQSYAHRLGLRYNRTNAVKGRTLFVSMNGNYQRNYIANSSFVARADTTLDGIFLSRGSQLNRPVNLELYWNASVFASYGVPVKMLKSNLNLNVNFNYSETPGLINEVLNFTKASALNFSLVLSSNISEKLDFTFSYAADLNQVRNSFQPQLNNDYLLHAGSATISWLPKGGLVLNSQASYTSYVGLGDVFNSSYLIWNAGIGYKFLKNKAADLRFTVFDILGQNNNLTRNVNEVYVEDIQNKVLQRYGMLTFTYTFKNFKAKTSK